MESVFLLEVETERRPSEDEGGCTDILDFILIISKNSSS